MSEPVLYDAMASLVCRVECIELNTQYVRSSFIKACELCKDREMVAAEIGVYEGVNARYMLLSNPNMKLILVDAWDNLTVYTGGPVQAPAFCKLVKAAAQFNIAGFPNVLFANKNSEDAVEDFPDEVFDYVYIDGDHMYQAALKDMQLWYPKVKTGGILGGHDVAMKEVSGALDVFVKENNIIKWGKDKPALNKSDWWIFK